LEAEGDIQTQAYQEGLHRSPARGQRAGAIGQAAGRKGSPPSAKPLELLTIKEAAAFAKVSTQSIRRWIKAGILKIYRAGRQTRIDESDLVHFLSLPDLK
jgi:excisionase family DNA binding protein